MRLTRHLLIFARINPLALGMLAVLLLLVQPASGQQRDSVPGNPDKRAKIEEAVRRFAPFGYIRPRLKARGTNKPNPQTALAQRCKRSDLVVYAFSYSVGKSVWQNYQFDLLSHVSVSGYTVNVKTGGPMSRGTWVSSEMRDSARAAGCKVHLTVTTIGGNGSTYTMLSNPSVAQACIDSICHYVKVFDADGVCLDFEDMHQAKDAPLFADWTIKLRQALLNTNANAEIAVAGPIILGSDSIYTQRSLYGAIDFNVMMGYDFTGSFSGPGCTSPLPGTSTFGGWNLMAGIHTYLKRGVSPRQLVLALPYYGYTWNTASTEIGSSNAGYVGAVTYDNVTNGMPNNGYVRHWDPASLSTYYTQTVNGQPRQTWMLDSLSLAMRYDSVLALGLRGMGIWELSYGCNSPELWELLNTKFGQCDFTIPVRPPSETSDWMTFHQPKLLWGVGAAFILLVIVVVVNRKAREEILNRHWWFPLMVLVGLNVGVFLYALFYNLMPPSLLAFTPLWMLTLASVALVIGYLVGRRTH